MAMDELFFRSVTVADMIAARDKRANRQREWLQAYASPLVSLTLNIAGPVKVTPLVAGGFAEAAQRITAQLARYGMDTLAHKLYEAFTGMEALWAVQSDAMQLKKAMATIEESDAFGRLLDIDVINTDGTKISRESVGLDTRRCLLCEKAAASCARSRAHAVDALVTRTEAILQETLLEQFADDVLSLAQRALLYEVAVTPKPGLVDRDNNGAHEDMDIFTFLNSASVFASYFRDCVQVGLRGSPPHEAFRMLRYRGMRAEDRMLHATSGVNTHQGAIFSLGLLCCAAGLLAVQGAAIGAKELCGMCVEMTEDALRAEMRGLDGLPGARGEAAAGFPSARLHGLPAYQKRRAAGDSVNDAGVYALMALMAVVEDANVARRGGRMRARQLCAQAQALLEDYTPQKVREMDTQLIHEHISPGGCADMLAVVFFLDGLNEIGGSTYSWAKACF